MHRPRLKQIIEWAKEIGKTICEMQDSDLKAEHKGKADLVTRADKASEAFLTNKILEAFPDHSILGEETGLHKGNPEHAWYVDPLDGTLNYAHGLPIYSISIAYAYKGELQTGVVYAPAMNELFSAQKGKGAWLNGKPIHTSGVDKMIDAMLITGFRFHLLDTPRSNIDNFVNLSHLVQTVRRIGSAAMDICYVACGRAEGFWELALNPWDVAAGALIVREAGGIAEPLYETKSLLTGTPDIVAANPQLYPAIRKVLEEKKI